MGDILKDSRFTKYLNDPRYKQIPKHERKVKIDKRFQSMFKDEKFKVKYSVDKRGRPINETSTENLRKYYDVEEESSSSSEEDTEETNKFEESDESKAGRFVIRPPSPDDRDNEQENNEKEEKKLSAHNDKLTRGKLDKKVKSRLLDLDIDYARGEGILQTDSSSEEESTDEEDESELEHEWGELDADAGTTEESTKRLAICNMDWDNIKATDLMVLLNSFLPPGGVIKKISIFPSEFGLKRMKQEEVQGPIELTEQKPDEKSDDDNVEGSSYHNEKLRRYQMNRLKYFYAVVECDAVSTADKLYNECDGMEYESSATRLDMRFIPDDVTFDEEPREVCTKLPDLTKYRPRLFTTTALQQAKVELTWDTTNPNRIETIKSALDGKIDDLDLKDYLASSSDSEDEERPEGVEAASDNEDDPIKKYKKLLEEIDKKEKKSNKDMEMEITWDTGIKDKAEELVKKKLNEDNKNMTPFEKLIVKRKEKKKEKKLKKKKEQSKDNDDDESKSEDYMSDDVPSDIDLNDPYFAEEFNKPEFNKFKSGSKKKKNKSEAVVDEEEERIKAQLELLLDDEDGKSHFSLNKIQESEISKQSKKKKKLKAKINEQKHTLPDFEIDVNDKRFSALYNSHDYNIDPSDPNFKKTKNMDKLIQEKLKRRPVDIPVEQNQPKKSKHDEELSILVKNVKRKTKVLGN